MPGPQQSCVPLPQAKHEEHRSPASSAQMPSHCVLQQYGSTPHTVVQQVPSEQKGVPVIVATQQLFGELPQLSTPPHDEHHRVASWEQVKSHAVLQQNGSTAHTRVQQPPSEQKGVANMDALQQEFGELPQLCTPPHDVHQLVASLAHWLSHWFVQQNESTAHTSEQQASSEQKGVLVEVAVQQSLYARPQARVPPQLGHHAVASLAHWASQRVLQQYGSWLHTRAQQSPSAQKGRVEDVQQSLEPTPQPDPPQLSHHWAASFAQMESQVLLQQNTSRLHTNWQQLLLLQPGPLPTAQQSLVLIPHCAAALLHNATSAIAPTAMSRLKFIQPSLLFEVPKSARLESSGCCANPRVCSLTHRVAGSCASM